MGVPIKINGLVGPAGKLQRSAKNNQLFARMLDDLPIDGPAMVAA